MLASATKAASRKLKPIVDNAVKQHFPRGPAWLSSRMACIHAPPWGRGSYIGEIDAARCLSEGQAVDLLDESYQGMALVSTSRRKRNHNQAWLMPMRFRKNPRNIPAGSFKPQRGMGVNGRTSATGAHVQAQPGRSQMKASTLSASRSPGSCNCCPSEIDAIKRQFLAGSQHAQCTRVPRGFARRSFAW